ncbi:hypothetical protein MYX06_05230 [Patescibacteria group bacterium AH-259-L05]|nr:hypothetical protein [Patescibacteria group bacterium AH-259-L05]
MTRLIQKIINAIDHVLPFPGDHPWDYFFHIIFSYILVFLFFTILAAFKVSDIASLIVAALTTFFIGLTKEIGDKSLGRTDTLGDMVTNILGIIAAILVLI